MTPDEAVDKMIEDPDFFFKYYPVNVAGAPKPYNPNQQNIKNFRLTRVAGKQGEKLGHQGATRPGFLHKKKISSFRLVPAQQVNDQDRSREIETSGVPMVLYNSDDFTKFGGAANLHGNLTTMNYYIVGPGTSYMTTGQLTGCCFAWCQSGDTLLCTHIRPAGSGPGGAAITGETLHNQVKATGRFQGLPHQALNTFGRLNYPEFATVIGVKSNGMWKLYAQISNDRLETLENAWQIHPGPVRQIR